MAVRSAVLSVTGDACILGAFCVFCSLLPAQPPAAPRRALVIANSNYAVLPKVPASSANSDVVKTALESLHFQVVVKRDLDQRALGAEIRAFTESLKPGDIVFFYYSGYGTDLEGDNYLLPVNYDPKDTRVPSVRAFLIGSFLDKLDEVKTGQRIVVLDSSWECPPLQSNSQGLSMMQPQHDRTLVSFNTAPSSVLKPPSGNAPSRFTAALVEALKKPGLTVSDVFNDVQKNGIQPGDTQRPFVAQSAIDNFAFIPARKEDPKVVMMERPPGPGERRINAKDQQTYVWIPSGPFQMGCVSSDAKCRPEEKPAHPVTLSKNFWITNSEITLTAYRLFLRANPTHSLPGKTKTYHGGLATEVPVTMVTWDDAQDYCKWAGEGGRLPTEAEWEYAARGGKAGEIYPWGNSNDAKTQANYYNTKSEIKKTFDESTPVRNFPENGWHLFDMAGNVREWVADMFDPDAYKGSGPFMDPLVTTGKIHVVRGGAWNSSDFELRTSFREGAKGARDNTTGFRCVLQKLEAQ
jgi:formylglycine-generating enzyme required for sulfatase activity